jgi:aspartate aminotransferase-like enzyme
MEMDMDTSVASQLDYGRIEKLFTPGPVNIPTRAYLASLLGSYHHRTKEFSAILRKTLEMLQPLFGTRGQVYPVHTTGRGALEGIYRNIFTPDDRVVCVVNGKFGEMAAITLTSIGIPVKECFPSWSSAVDLAVLEKEMVEFKATGLVAVFNDTSNGVINPMAQMGALAKKHDVLFAVDNVSALGCMPFEMDAWGVDAVATASQKGLMSPAGLSFVALSPKAMAACQANQNRDFYIDFVDIHKNVTEKGETPGSTPVSLMLSVHEALTMIYEEGIETVFLRHKAISAGTKAALVALGFSLYPLQCEARSDSLTVATMPQGLSAKRLSAAMCQQYKLRIGVGLGSAMADNTVRIAHMGYCYVEDMLQCFAVMECVLTEMGMNGIMGKGTQAFHQAYGKTMAEGL